MTLRAKLSLSGLFLLTCISCLSAQSCQVSFQVVALDRLNNYDSGIPPKSRKDIEKRLSKYPGICYSDSPAADLVFFIHTTPWTYHGHHVYTSNSSSAAAVSDGNGGAAAAAASSSSSVAVPYDVDYSVFILDVEVPKVDGNYKVVRSFDQKGLYHTIYGIGYGKGKHPIPNVIEAAAAWVQADLLRVVSEVADAKVQVQVAVSPNGTGPMASLLVESNVAGADIEVDGTFVGNTPSIISISAGKHTIVVKKKGYTDWTRTTNVAGTGAKLSAELDAKP